MIIPSHERSKPFEKVRNAMTERLWHEVNEVVGRELVSDLAEKLPELSREDLNRIRESF
jgi:hypothetical protein